MKIRAATSDDHPWIITQLRLFSDEYGNKHKLFPSPDYAEAFLRNIADQHLLLVAEHNTAGVVGFIGGFIHTHLFNPDIRQLTECFWWVTPEHRGGRAGLMLFEAFHEWGAKNVDWVGATLEAHSPVKEEFLTKRGYVLRERSYVMEV